MKPASIAAAYSAASVERPIIAVRFRPSLRHKICEGERPSAPERTTRSSRSPGSTALASAAFASPTRASIAASSRERITRDSILSNGSPIAMLFESNPGIDDRQQQIRYEISGDQHQDEHYY